MHTVHIIIAILVVLLAATIYMWITKPSAVQIIPANQETCDCSNKIDESYDIGYADGSNLTTMAEDDDGTMETFYDYESSAGKGKKKEAKTGSPVVKQVGGLCPKATKEITSGKNKGKCQRTGDWYKTYRGTDEKGKAFTCTGGRVSNGKQCVCDESGGKQWNGKKCMCASGYNWDSKSKRCIKKGQFKDLLNKMNAKKAPKPSPAKKPAASSGFHQPSNAGKPSSAKKPAASSDFHKPSNAGKPSSAPLKKPITSFNGARQPSNFK
ncbi:hypothetical protein ATCVTN60342_553L [Acanthocystis turfacea Chlorella virus TN603.4.2]|nr:hypothetical protein ATCVTN60342_553L [Acanthocystis turfacea Chlorella virus TN603.4.2]